MIIERFLIAPVRWTQYKFDAEIGEHYEIIERPTNAEDFKNKVLIAPEICEQIPGLTYTYHSMRVGAPLENDLDVMRIRFDDQYLAQIANDPASYLWEDDPIPFAAWVNSNHGMTKASLDRHVANWLRNTSEFVAFKASVREALPEEG